MKKVFLFIAAAVMAAASCQKESASSVDAGNVNAGSRRLTATFVQSKVSYDEVGNNLQPAWEEGDKIIGFDDAGTTYTLTVSSVSDGGVATLSGTVPDGSLHLIYKSGAEKGNIQDKSLAVSYVNQAGDKTMPAVMLSDGTVSDGSGNFEFINAGAVIGIWNAKGVPAESVISKVTISGSNLSGATVSIEDGNLILKAKEKVTDAISAADLTEITVTDANGTLSSPVFIAVPADAKVSKVTLTVGGDTYSSSTTQAKICDASAYLYVKTQVFKKDLPKGALPGEFTVNAEGKKVYFSKGNLYYDGSNFNFETNQYDFQSSWSTSHVSHFYWSKTASVACAESYSESGTSDSDVFFTNADGFTVNVGGAEQSGWRTLSKDEWTYLINKNGDENIRKDKFKYAVTVCEKTSCLVLAPDDFTGTIEASYDATAWASAEADGLVCLPAAGSRGGSDVGYVGVSGNYWSSAAGGSNFAYFVSFISSYVYPDLSEYRYYGFSVRLITESK